MSQPDSLVASAPSVRTSLVSMPLENPSSWVFSSCPLAQLCTLPLPHNLVPGHPDCEPTERASRERETETERRACVPQTTASWLHSQTPPYDISLCFEVFPVLFAVDMKSLYCKNPLTCLGPGFPIQIHCFSWGVPPCPQAGCAAGSCPVSISLQRAHSTTVTTGLFCPLERMAGL